MKYLALILLLVPFSLFSQVDVKVETSKKETVGQRMNANTEARAAATEAAAAATEAAALRSSAMDAPTTEVIVPIAVDLNNYTHIALVSINGLTGRTKELYNWAENILLESPFVVVNPTSERKLFKKNPLYLKSSKDPNWLYVYYTRTSVGVNELRDLVVKDSKNQIIYSVKHKNVPANQVLQSLINF